MHERSLGQRGACSRARA